MPWNGLFCYTEGYGNPECETVPAVLSDLQ
jgi:hypothetical protein